MFYSYSHNVSTTPAAGISFFITGVTQSPVASVESIRWPEPNPRYHVRTALSGICSSIRSCAAKRTVGNCLWTAMAGEPVTRRHLSLDGTRRIGKQPLNTPEVGAVMLSCLDPHTGVLAQQRQHRMQAVGAWCVSRQMAAHPPKRAASICS